MNVVDQSLGEAAYETLSIRFLEADRVYFVRKSYRIVSEPIAIVSIVITNKK